MTLTSKGQVTIPLELRQALGLMPGTQVVFDQVGNSVRIGKAAGQRRGTALIERMRTAGRQATGPHMTTDEILALTRGE
jgi:AbrB family looped-hinge helix DNA binding protein